MRSHPNASHSARTAAKCEVLSVQRSKERQEEVISELVSLSMGEMIGQPFSVEERTRELSAQRV